MRLFKTLIPLIIFAAVVISCEGDYRKEARGDFGSAVVVMDSTMWDSETATAIRNSYGDKIEHFFGFEPRFSLTFKNFTSNDELEEVKFNKNIIIASPIDSESNTGQLIRALLSDEVEESVRAGEAFAFPLQNKWYRNQWTILLTSTSDSALASHIRRGEQRLVQSLLDKELERWTEEIYEKGEQTAIEDSLWANRGWKIRVQHDYTVHLDTTYVENGQTNHFFTMQRLLPENDRRFWAWWKDDVKNIQFLDEDWINAKRDSLFNQWIRGSRDSSYVTTEYRIDPQTSSFLQNGNFAYETLGWWRMTHDAMGGPFVNMTVYDEDSQRLFMYGFVQFAPKYPKRRFVRQFRAIVRTFESDSTWNNTDNRVASN